MSAAACLLIHEGLLVWHHVCGQLGLRARGEQGFSRVLLWGELSSFGKHPFSPSGQRFPARCLSGTFPNHLQWETAPESPLPASPPAPHVPLSSTGSALWNCLASFRAPGEEKGGRFRAALCTWGCTLRFGGPKSSP